MSIVIFYLDFASCPAKYDYPDQDFNSALEMTQFLRNKGMRHVCMSNEPANMVGKPGVDSIKDGKTPDGHDYDWSKADRAGKMRAKDANKLLQNGADL